MKDNLSNNHLKLKSIYSLDCKCQEACVGWAGRARRSRVSWYSDDNAVRCCIRFLHLSTSPTSALGIFSAGSRLKEGDRDKTRLLTFAKEAGVARLTRAGKAWSKLMLELSWSNRKDYRKKARNRKLFVKVGKASGSTGWQGVAQLDRKWFPATALQVQMGQSSGRLLQTTASRLPFLSRDWQLH